MREQASKCGRIIGLGAMMLWAFSGAGRTAHAESVYKCRGADGLVAFQDHACAKTEVESQIEILPAPPPMPSPEYSVGSRTDRGARVGTRAGGSRQTGSKARTEVVSYECRAANGELFYRHGACPKQITAKSSGGTSRRRSGADLQPFAVSAQPLSRTEVCQRLRSAGSIGRAGRERDENVSTYDRNLGRDPCRRF